MELDQIYLVCTVALAPFVVSAGHLKILFHFYFPEYEMDWKSIAVIPLKTFVPASLIAMVSLFWLDYLGGVWPGIIVASCLAVYIAQRLFVKAGMERSEAFRLIFPWYSTMLLLWLFFLILNGYLKVVSNG